MLDRNQPAVILPRIAAGSGTVYPSYPNLIAAGRTDEGDYLPFELWGGESPITTNQGTVGTAAIAQFQVIARFTDGTLIPWDGTTMTGVGAPIGFAALPGAVGAPLPYYDGGSPDHQALVWPAGVTTLAQRKAAFDGTAIHVCEILGISGRIVYPINT